MKKNLVKKLGVAGVLPFAAVAFAACGDVDADNKIYVEVAGETVYLNTDAEVQDAINAAVATAIAGLRDEDQVAEVVRAAVANALIGMSNADQVTAAVDAAVASALVGMSDEDTVADVVKTAVATELAGMSTADQVQSAISSAIANEYATLGIESIDLNANLGQINAVYNTIADQSTTDADVNSGFYTLIGECASAKGVTLNGVALSTTARKVSVGLNAFKNVNDFKVEDGKLYVSTLVLAFEALENANRLSVLTVDGTINILAIAPVAVSQELTIKGVSVKTGAGETAITANDEGVYEIGEIAVANKGTTRLWVEFDGVSSSDSCITKSTQTVNDVTAVAFGGTGLKPDGSTDTTRAIYSVYAAYNQTAGDTVARTITIYVVGAGFATVSFTASVVA